VVGDAEDPADEEDIEVGVNVTEGNTSDGDPEASLQNC